MGLRAILNWFWYWSISKHLVLCTITNLKNWRMRFRLTKFDYHVYSKLEWLSFEIQYVTSKTVSSHGHMLELRDTHAKISKVTIPRVGVAPIAFSTPKQRVTMNIFPPGKVREPRTPRAEHAFDCDTLGSRVPRGPCILFSSWHRGLSFFTLNIRQGRVLCFLCVKITFFF